MGVEVEDREETADVLSEKERILEIVKRKLGRNYKDFEFIGMGSEAYTLKAKWGPAGALRAIRVDRLDINHPRSLRHHERGYGTKNHINTLADLGEAEAYGIIGLLDFVDSPEDGVSIAIHKLVEGGKTLEDRIQERGPQSLPEIKAVYSSIIRSAKYFHSKGVMHRDLGTRNVMVEGDDTVENVKVLDFGIAGRGKAPGILSTTAGNRFIRDPRNIYGDSSYDFKSDLYSIGADIFYSLKGKGSFEFDPDKGIARVCSTGESLLGGDGELIKTKFEEALDKEIDNLPKYAKRLGRVVKRCMTLDEKLRYSSIEELEKDFNSAFAPGLFERVKKGWKKAAAIGMIASLPFMGVAGGIYSHSVNRARQLEQKIIEEGKFLISSQFDGATLEYETNIFDLDLDLVDMKKNYKLLYGTDFRNGNRLVPSMIYLSREDLEDELQLTAYIREKPKNAKTAGNSFPSFLSNVYLKGREGKLVFAHSESCDSAAHVDYDGFRGMRNTVNFKVPNDLPDGVYTLVLDVYAHDPSTKCEWENNMLKISRYEHPGRVLASKPISMVIGKPEEGLRITNLALDSYGGLLSIYPFEKMGDIRKGITYEFYIPELGFRHQIVDSERNPVNCFSCTPASFLPKPEDDKEKTLIVTARDSEGKIIMYDGFNIRRDQLLKDSPDWKVCPYDKTFSERLQTYRAGLH